MKGAVEGEGGIGKQQKRNDELSRGLGPFRQLPARALSVFNLVRYSCISGEKPTLLVSKVFSDLVCYVWKREGRQRLGQGWR